MPFGIDDLAAAALPIAGSAGSGLINTMVGINQARINRQFQLGMSSTAYQRAMEDMRRAGLNPMLAYQQGGASTASGSTAQGGFQGDLGASSAVQAYQQNQRLKNETKLTDAQAHEHEARADYHRIRSQLDLDEFNSYRPTEARLNQARTSTEYARAGATRSETNLLDAKTATELLEPGRTRADIELKKTGASANKASAERDISQKFLNDANTTLQQLREPEARVWATFYNTIAPFAGAIGRAMNVVGAKIDKMSGEEIHAAIGNALKRENTDAAAAWDHVRNYVTDKHLYSDSPLSKFLRSRQTWSKQ